MIVKKYLIKLKNPDSISQPDTGFTKNEIGDLFEALDMFNGIKSISAYDLLEAEKQGPARNITTLSKSFDQILGGLIFIL